MTTDDPVERVARALEAEDPVVMGMLSDEEKIDLARAAIAAMPRVPEWQDIATYDGPDCRSVLVYCDSGLDSLMPGDKCTFTAFRYTGKWFHFSGGPQTEIQHATHWQPLPAPPKEPT